MPKLNDRFRLLREEADWSTADLAERLELAEGSLRNAEGGREPMSRRRIFRAARLFTDQLKRPITGEDIAFITSSTGDGVPEQPPEQPKPRPKPERRKEPADKGPKRIERGAA